MADTNAVPKNAPGNSGEYEFLFGKDIPFKHELHVFLWHLPGIFCAVVIGVVVNVLLEEILKRISKRVAEHPLTTIVGVVVIFYLIFATNFDTWLATQIHWWKIVPWPYGPAR